MENKYKWVLEIEDAKKYMPEIYQLIADEIGMENLLRLISLLKKSMVYFTTSPIMDIAAIYIQRNHSMSPVDLARKLDVSVNYVYDVKKRLQKPVDQQQELLK